MRLIFNPNKSVLASLKQVNHSAHLKFGAKTCGWLETNENVCKRVTISFDFYTYSFLFGTLRQYIRLVSSIKHAKKVQLDAYRIQIRPSDHDVMAILAPIGDVDA